MKRYERLAEDIGSLIRRGTLTVGERAPSVRQIRRSHDVSPGTALRAYGLLADRGFIEAVPRSGYYVSSLWRSHAEPAASRPSRTPTPVGASAVIFQLFDAARDPAIVPFGSPFISSTLFPLNHLAQCLRAHARVPNAWIEDLPPGSLKLRRYIALRCAHSGAVVAPEEIVLTTGCLEALYLSLDTVTRPGDLVAIESPAFHGCLQALDVLGRQAVEVPTHPRLGVDLAALSKILATKPVRACWLMPTFHNPTGALVPDAAKRELARLLERHDVPLIEDGAYQELYFGEQNPKPVKAYDRKGLVLFCGSFSKSLAPGYRIGWLAAGRYTQKVCQLKTAVTLATCYPVQEAIASYLGRFSYERHLRTLRKALYAQQSAMLQSMERHLPPGCSVTRPAGGYMLWIELPESVDAVALHRRALASGFSIAPGPIFSARGEFTNCIRLNYGHPWTAAADSAMRTLGELVRGELARSATDRAAHARVAAA